MRLLIIILLTLNVCIANAQKTKYKVKVTEWKEAVVTLKNGEQMEGIIKYKTKRRHLRGKKKQLLYFKKDESSKKVKYSYKDVDYFEKKSFGSFGHKYTYIPIKKGRYKIFRIEKEGDITLYSRWVYWYNASAPSGLQTSYAKELYVKKDSESIAYPIAKGFRGRKHFKKQMRSYFGSSEELEKILEEDLGHGGRYQSITEAETKIVLYAIGQLKDDTDID